MKTGTIDHPKFKALAAKLKKPAYVIVGVLESLWYVTAKWKEHGGIGEWTNAVIASAIDWRGSADQLIVALTDTGWLDADEQYRLVVHDWFDHCPKYIDDKLRKREERAKKRTNVDVPRHVPDSPGQSGTNADSLGTALPSPPLPSLPFPSPPNPPAGGVVGGEMADPEEICAGAEGFSTVPPTEPARFTRAHVETLLLAYPKKVALKAARNAAEQALCDIAHRPQPPPNPFEWLLEKVKLFAASRMGNKGEKTPNAATWFYDARYDDDPAEWNKGGSDKDLEDRERKRKQAGQAMAVDAATKRRADEEARLKAQADTSKGDFAELAKLVKKGKANHPPAGVPLAAVIAEVVP